MGEKAAWHSSWWIGAGAFMLAAAIQIGSSVWPDQIKPHPYAVITLGIIGALFVLAGIGRAIWLWIDSRAKTSSITSPLEIIFEPLNPARRFWSLESHLDDYKRLIGTFWEHRIEIKNNSSVTLRNVTVMVERTGPSPVKPQRALFVRTKTESCDINPGCSELVLVNRWPHPKTQVGMLAGPSAWGYGPINVIASAHDTLPAETIFDFNYETDQMLFERGKY
jgi:hypothetical protein